MSLFCMACKQVRLRTAQFQVQERPHSYSMRRRSGLRAAGRWLALIGVYVLSDACGGAAGVAGSMLVVSLLDAHLFGVRPSDAAWLVALVAASIDSIAAIRIDCVHPARVPFGTANSGTASAGVTPSV